MRTIYDVQQFLKGYGTIIYTGDRTCDLELMKSEIQELYMSQLISKQDIQMALQLLNDEIIRLRKEPF